MTIQFAHYGMRCFGLVIREIGRFYRLSLDDGTECWIGESQIIRKFAA